MKTVRLLAAALLIALLAWPAVLWGASAASDAPVADDAGKAVEAVIRTHDLQTELPAPKTMRPMPEPPRLNFPDWLAQTLLWLAVITVVLVIAANLRGNLWSSSKTRKLEGREDPDEAPQAVTARMDSAQLAADDLARLGHFAEAMHVLLLQSVGELRRRLGISIAASLTSREILHRVKLSPEGRGAFGDIIGRVEISWFGGHQPDQSEYLACRQSFEGLARALAQGRRP
ncbi:DUF4129 domain-containing protein [Deltaproteobacteria bacterium OttesenSCG-928-M10]|nr:DUF4129 domain-containing protein [Deltaproteobacteria bacterium OttesenSCG-928-M10]